MGSLSVQPPSGLTRNLTEVYFFLRNNAQQNAATIEFGGIGGGDDDRVALIGLKEGRDATSSGYSKNPPQWVNVLDEINYEMTRIRTRKVTLRELEQTHLGGLDFNDESTSPEQEKIKDLTDEITSIFSHCRRLIRLIEEGEANESTSYTRLRENVVSAMVLLLNDLLHSFRASQSTYLKRLDTRKENVDSFLLATSSQSVPFAHSASNNPVAGNYPVEDTEEEEEELTIDQIQTIMQNEHMTKEREQEIMRISKSILELNSLFKDLASMIVDQGTIVDRVDYNVERSAMRIKTAYKSVQKAEQYQKDRKMKLIMFLAGIALFLMLIILITKF